MDKLTKMSMPNIGNYNVGSSDDLEKMTPEERWNIARQLMMANAGLLYQFGETEKKYKETLTYNVTLFNQINDYKEQEKIIKRLQEESQTMKKIVDDQNNRIITLEKKVNFLEKRDILACLAWRIL